MTRKLTLALLLIFMGAMCANAQTKDITDAKQKQQVINKINSAAGAIKSIACDFVQTKHLKMLNDKMVSNGKMYYRQADKLRWEYTSPYTYTFILNGTKVKMANNKRTDVIDTKSNKLFKEIAQIMMNSVTGKCLSEKTDFDISIAENKTYWIVTMVPVKKELKSMFSKVVLSFNKAESMVHEVNIYEKNNDRTQIALKNIKTNTTISDATFSIN